MKENNDSPGISFERVDIPDVAGVRDACVSEVLYAERVVVSMWFAAMVREE